MFFFFFNGHVQTLVGTGVQLLCYELAVLVTYGEFNDPNQSTEGFSVHDHKKITAANACLISSVDLELLHGDLRIDFK